MVKYIGLLSIINLLIFISILLFKKSGIKKANKYLAVFLILMTIIQSVFLIWHAGYYKHFPWAIHLDYVALSLFGFSFYCYIRSMTMEEIQFNNKSLVHFVPFVFIVSFYIYFQLHGYDYKMQYVAASYIEYPLIEYILSIGTTLLIVFYFVLSYRKVNTYRKKIKEFFSDIHHINLKWINNLLLIFAGLFIGGGVFLNTLESSVKEELNELVGIPILAAFYVLFFIKTINHPSIFNTHVTLEKNDFDQMQGSKHKKKDRPEVKKELLDNYFNEIVDIIKQEKLYLKPRLTVKDLSNKIDLPIHFLSKVINLKSGGNFFSFINTFRVKEAKRCLRDENHRQYTVEAIGKECGFNSAASFFEVFKKETGMTPTKYRQKQDVHKIGT